MSSAGPTIDGCTIVDNTSSTSSGSGVYCYSSDQTLIMNSIIWGNSFYVYGTHPLAVYSCVENGSGAYFSTGCIDADPLFVDAVNGKYQLKQWGTHSVHSPCVDRGNPFALNLPGLSTREDRIGDQGYLDMGYRKPATIIAPALAITNLVSGQTAAVSISGCTPNGAVYFVWSAQSGGPTKTAFGAGYVGPVHAVIAVTADANGDVIMYQPVPTGHSGRTLWFHGLDFGLRALIAPLTMTIG